MKSNLSFLQLLKIIICHILKTNLKSSNKILFYNLIGLCKAKVFIVNDEVRNVFLFFRQQTESFNNLLQSRRDSIFWLSRSRIVISKSIELFKLKLRDSFEPERNQRSQICSCSCDINFKLFRTKVKKKIIWFGEFSIIRDTV